MKLIVDTRELKDLTKTLGEYAAYSKRSNAVVVDKQAQQLAIGSKGVRGLYQEARFVEGPKTKQEIRALLTKLGHRIRRYGGTAEAEIRRRAAKAGLYQSTGWISDRYSINSARRLVTTSRGRVSLSLRGDRPSVTIFNESIGAAEFANRTGYIGRAISNRVRDMRVYLTRKLASDAKRFSRPKPKFPKSISQQLDELLRV